MLADDQKLSGRIEKALHPVDSEKRYFSANILFCHYNRLLSVADVVYIMHAFYRCNFVGCKIDTHYRIEATTHHLLWSRKQHKCHVSREI